MADDAGVVRLNDEEALIQTVDFFSPVLDDPFDFGQAAAANALSDVYAMGGRPLSALNVVAFPAGQEMDLLHQILRGGQEKVREAGAFLVGGHTVDDPDIKYGLSVTGLVHPEHILTNSGARAGDKLILTKPLGTGILATALKRGKAEPDMVDLLTATMIRLNRWASESALKHGAHGATDVTGFGLAGHALEMAAASQVTLTIETGMVPFIDGAYEAARQGLIPGGTKRNLDHFRCWEEGSDDLVRPLVSLLHDPQTSGGLLLSVPSDQAEACLDAIHKGGDGRAAIIGEVLPEPKGRIQFL